MKRLTELYPAFERLLSGVLPRSSNAFSLPHVPPSAASLIATTLGHPRALIITPTPALAEQVASDAALLLPKHLTTLLPPADDDETILSGGERFALAQKILSAPEQSIAVTSIHALLQPIPEPTALAQASITFEVGKDIPFDTLAELLTQRGYIRREWVMEPMTFAVRGGLIDIWPGGAELPVRCDFFGDTVDAIKHFDPNNQCSISKLSSIVITPGAGAQLPMVQLLPQLLDRDIFIFDAPLIEETLDQLKRVSRGTSNAVWFDKMMALAKGRVAYAGEPFHDGAPAIALLVHEVNGVGELAGVGGKHAPEFYTRVRHELLADLDKQARAKRQVLICADASAAQELISADLPKDSKLSPILAPLSQGFVCENLKLTVVTQNDLYPVRRTWHPQARKNTSAVAGARLEYAFDVEPGELVVHLEHGIGRFLGLSELELNGKRVEVFTLEYADKTKLYVPTSHAHLLSRYIGPDPKHAKLHSLDGTRWRKEKDAAQRSIEDLAVSLLETQARRRVMPGFAFKLDEPWIAEFEALFPYHETPDQKRVIEEIKADMASPVAMDRLLCGDAGYGKTEVAMRAAFIAIMNHKQVAVLAPTTVLAEQHYETFCDRMSAFPVRIDVLSRFRSQGRRADTRAAAAAGKVDILIGTHALLTENVPFKDLGLLIIDEEQRFGVAHKEKLKQLRSLVDVLTLSATPIPRTLYLSLTGARDLSLLQTPPSNRLAVTTQIIRDEDDRVAKVIANELARGGQVFYLYNRVMTIGRILDRVKRLVPEAKPAVAHGQMSTTELATTMRAFEHGETNVLICTTIIESGIDIPRANTILIDRADRFGLADLYQLRGRVGRSAVKGLAVLLLPVDRPIENDSRLRLEALKRHSGLGAGYNIALRDLEIRGSGNLLGAAQSGHIAAIGFGLYCQLLRRTVARLKGERPQTLVDTELALDFIDTSPSAEGDNAVSLPYGYIDDEALRMNAYRRTAEAVRKQEIITLQAELKDRFGPLPPAVVRYFKLATLRMVASQKGIVKIQVKDGYLTCLSRQQRNPIRGLEHLPFSPTKSADTRINTLLKLIQSLPDNAH